MCQHVPSISIKIEINILGETDVTVASSTFQTIHCNLLEIVFVDNFQLGETLKYNLIMDLLNKSQILTEIKYIHTVRLDTRFSGKIHTEPFLKFLDTVPVNNIEIIEDIQNDLYTYNYKLENNIIFEVDTDSSKNNTTCNTSDKSNKSLSILLRNIHRKMSKKMKKVFHNTPRIILEHPPTII